MATCTTCGNNCGSQGKCGCNDSVLHLPPNCNPPDCPNPEPCPETFSDCCVIHNGDTFTYVDSEEAGEPGFFTYQGERWCDIWQRFIVSQYCTDFTIQPPYGLKSIAITATTINIAWTQVPLIEGYEIWLAPASTTPTFTLQGTVLNNTTPNFTLTGLTANTMYYIFVKSYAADVKSCPSITLVLTTKVS